MNYASNTMWTQPEYLLLSWCYSGQASRKVYIFINIFTCTFSPTNVISSKRKNEKSPLKAVYLADAEEHTQVK